MNSGSPSNAEFKRSFQFKGFQERRIPTKFVDGLDDEALRTLNGLLDWHAFTVDAHGRRFGAPAWPGKRNEPQQIPDPRILRLHQTLDLSDQHVLEVGCFEGIHTIALCSFARRVTAVDARIENVVRTIVRCAMFGHAPTVLTCDLERRPLDRAVLEADVIHHVGVFYHLADPVAHLIELCTLARRAIFLDTHYAADAEATQTYESGGRSYRFRPYGEHDLSAPFAGMSSLSRWLRLDDLQQILRDGGFGRIDKLEDRAERNGPRISLLARR